MDELTVVRKANSIAGENRKADLAMDAVARWGHLAFLVYGASVWFMGGEGRRERRRYCTETLCAVALSSLISYGIGKLWKRNRPFTQDWRIWNFSGHRANASFPSNHTMNAAAVSLGALSRGMPAAALMAFLTGVLAFSRLVAGIHYPTDLLGGIGIAGAVGKILRMKKPAAEISKMAAFLSDVSDGVISLMRGRGRGGI